MKKRDLKTKLFAGMLSAAVAIAAAVPAADVAAQEISSVQSAADDAAAYTEDGYHYVYAGISWAEYWKNEAVYQAGNAESSTEQDTRGELDKGAFDTVSRATTNHGLHRGSYQCNAQITLKDGTKLDVAYYTGTTEGVLTNGEKFSYDKSDIAEYVVTGLKYVPVKVADADYEEFKKAYTVVENGETLNGGFSEGNLKSYTDLKADVTAATNGLKTAEKQEDGTFAFSARVSDGTDSGIADTALKTAGEGIISTVKPADGAYGEFLRVDLTGDYGDLGANMQAVKWTYYGDDSTYEKPLQSYGTKFAADNWMHKANGIQLGLTDSIRCKLPEGTDGTGYWKLTVYALGYNDYTILFQATEDNIVQDGDEALDLSALQEAVKKAEALQESDYTKESYSSFQTELQEAKEELKTPHTQATINEALAHLNAAMEALVKADKTTDTTTPATPSTPETPSTSGNDTVTITTTDSSAKQEPAAGTVKVIGKVEYRVTGSKKATVSRCTDKSIRTAKIQDTVTIDGYTFKVTGISDKAFYGCKKLTTVTIGSGVSKIGKKAFSQCTALKTITIKSTSLKKSSVGSAAFKGIKKNATVKVPAKKVSDYRKILKAKGAGKNIKVKKI